MTKLEKLKIDFQSEKFLFEASEFAQYEIDTLKQYINTSFEEAEHTLNLIQNISMEGKRVLEFGSGLGIASIILEMCHVDIVSFEPGGLGFEKNALLNQFIKKYFGFNLLLINNINDLKKESFDFIFSNNVLEHIENLDETLCILHSILKSKGQMIHNIPNYIIPYEPHFGIPFFPIFPKKMSSILPKTITNTNVWKSLNFVNYFDIKQYAKANNASIVFQKSLLYKALQRLLIDEEFGNRHQLIRNIVRVLNSTNILVLFKFIPAFLSTPMVFIWSKND